MVDPTTMISFGNSPLTARYMPRPRIDKIFDRASRCKLLYVIAGAGYGKTQAVYHYIKERTDSNIRWLQLTESDNIGSHYWESLTHSISFDNPDLAAKLREYGFPETLARFKQFAEILRDSEHRSKKTFLILDDFHVIHTKQALTFAERCAHLEIPGACVILISRKEPEINAVSLLSKGRAGIITEDELRFTESEIAEYFKLCNIPFSVKDLPRFVETTKGWALAVKLLSLVLERIPGNLDYAIDTMKQNIFELLETEAFRDIPNGIRKTLVRLSLISNQLMTPVQVIADDASFIESIPQLASFIWFDRFIGDYRIHPLYLEFLQSKHQILTEEEKLDTYRRAAEWCIDNDFYMDAMDFYAKSHQYERMLKFLLSRPFKLPPDACEYYLGILEDLTADSEGDNRSVILLKDYFLPNLLIGAGKYDEARQRCLDVINEWERADTVESPGMISAVYSKLAYIDMFTCTATHEYNFPEYLKKSVEYNMLAPAPPVEISGPFAVTDIRTFACLVGEGATLAEFDVFLERAREAAGYLSNAYHKMYSGYDELAACEVAFFRGRLDAARDCALGAIMKARENKQYNTEALAQYYLLRIAVHAADYPMTKEILGQFRSHLDNPDFWNRRLLWGLFTGSFYVHIGLPNMAPQWLAIDENDTSSEVRIPARETIVGVRYYIASGKYRQALAVLCNSYPREPRERFLFGELIFSLLFAVARLKTGDKTGAVKDFAKAFELSFRGEFEMPFVELGKMFRYLAAAASSVPDCGIPGDWLASTERKASVYAKKSAVIADAFRKEKKASEPVQLSQREREVLSDLYHGLSREEIATSRYLSINTVKKTLQSVYRKLDANNKADAIRIAVEMELVK